MAATDETGTHETDGAIGTKGDPVPDPVAAVQPDTTEAGRVDASGWSVTDTDMAATPDTLTSVVVDKYNDYKASEPFVPGETKDTTLTDQPVADGTAWNEFNPDLAMTGTLETHQFGAVPAGSPLVPVAPNAPTVVSADRHVMVSWAAVADPHADAPVLQYVIESDSGGHAYAGRDATSKRFDNVTGGRAQKFRVRAGNRNGTGPYSDWSASSVAPGNEDLIRPTALAADNTINPIYRQDGSIVPGSYGAPTAPGKPTVAAQGTAGTATVTWTASSPEPSGGYDVRASSGETAHVASGVHTADVADLEVATEVTFTVTAVGELQSVTSPASDPYTVT